MDSEKKWEGIFFFQGQLVFFSCIRPAFALLPKQNSGSFHRQSRVQSCATAERSHRVLRKGNHVLSFSWLSCFKLRSHFDTTQLCLNTWLKFLAPKFRFSIVCVWVSVCVCVCVCLFLFLSLCFLFSLFDFPSFVVGHCGKWRQEWRGMEYPLRLLHLRQLV